MPQPAPARNGFRFGSFELDVQGRELRKSGIRIKLQDQPFQVLLILVEKQGIVVTREELRSRIWPADTFVDFDKSLNTAVAKIREALGDAAEFPRFIETVPRHGYRFVAPVEVVEPPISASASPPPRPAFQPGWHHRSQRTLMIAATLVLIAMAAIFVGSRLRNRSQQQIRADSVHSLAVLPLENLSDDPAQEYFADGMTEALISRLAQASELNVISRTSVLPYKRVRKPIGVIARELKVDAIVEGTVVRAGDRVRVSAQLVHAPTDRHLWSASYDRELRDVLSVQSDIAAAVAEQIKVRLTSDENQRLRSRRLVQPDAYEAYFRGRYLVNESTTETGKRAISEFQRAIEMDPDFALAYVGLAQAYMQLAQPMNTGSGRMPSEWLSAAETAIETALRLDDNIGDAHAVRATVQLLGHWNWTAANAEYQRAIALEPSSADSHLYYAVYLHVRREASALAEIERAKQLDPLNLRIRCVAAELYHAAGQLNRADGEIRGALEMNPNYARAYFVQARLFAYQDKGADAIAAYKKWHELSGTKPTEVRAMADGFATAGMQGFYAAWIHKLERDAQHTAVRPSNFAALYALTGDKDRAFAYLERAYEEHDGGLVFINVADAYANLRSDPRFENLLRRIGYPLAAE